MYEMHNCNSAKQDLTATADLAGTALQGMNKEVSAALALSGSMQKSAESLQQSFGAVGDKAATDLMQKAKVFAGKLEHQAASVDAASSKLAALIGDSSSMEVTDSVASVR